jgi:hypothetical protein
MDKVMKAEIEKILKNQLSSIEELCGVKLPKVFWQEGLSQATSHLTALIIKWLEGKRGQQCLASGEYERNKMFGRNQLITELIGEVR